MKLYHGTTERKAGYIEREGFVGGELDSLTCLKNVHGGVVYMAETAEEAAEYGEAVFEIEFCDGADAPVPFSDGNTQHYYTTDENINQACGIKRIN